MSNNLKLSYCERVTGAPFNWFEALEKAKKMGLSQSQEAYDFKLDLKNKSTSWVTCAVGNQCNIIPRRYDRLPEGESFETIVRGTENAPPVDTELADLGIKFMFRVEGEVWNEAIKTLHEIEARSAVLIREILGNG